MKFNAGKGGHATAALREAFEAWVVNDDEDIVYLNGDANDSKTAKPLRWLIGQLWNCSDVLPSSYCNLLGLPQGSTYAQAEDTLSAYVSKAAFLE